MLRISRVSCLIAMAALLGACAFAQKPAPASPKFILLVEERVQPGKAPAHARMEAEWADALRKSGDKKVFLLALNPTAGPSVVDFLWCAESPQDFAQFGDNPASAAATRQYLPREAEFLSDTNSMLLQLRDDLSYHPAFDFADSPLVIVGVERVRKGHTAEYKEYQELLNKARETAGSKLHTSIYQVVSGAKDDTYIYIVPFNPAQIEHDVDLSGDQEKRRLELIDKIIVDTSPVVFEIAPKMSWPTDAMLAANPAFWNPKPPLADIPAVHKGVVPAAKQTPEKK